MFYPDLTPHNPRDPSMLAVGWLDPQQAEYTQGQFPSELLQFLEGLPTTHQTRGMHKCPYCDQDGSAKWGDVPTSSNEIHVKANGKTYAAPRLILHYIKDHNYCPPSEYVDAVRSCAGPECQPGAQATPMAPEAGGDDASFEIGGGAEQVDMSDQDGVYESVVKRINAGIVTTDDFNSLIEATDKSTRERIHRRTRATNPEPAQASLIGRVVPKKSGRNDPPNQGRGRRYAAGSPAKERQNAEQRRRMSARVTEAIKHLIGNKSAEPARLVSGDLDIVKGIRASASALLRSPGALAIIGEGVDTPQMRDWLYAVVLAADGRLLDEGERPEDVRPVRLIVERKAQGTQEKGRPDATGRTTGQHGLVGRVLIEKKRKKDKGNAKEESGKNGGGKDEETRSYEVTGKPEQLDNLEKLLKWVEYCGNVGHSGTAKLSVDGDGSARLKFDGVTADLPDETGSYDPEVHVGIV